MLYTVCLGSWDKVQNNLDPWSTCNLSELFKHVSWISTAFVHLTLNSFSMLNTTLQVQS